MTTEQIDVINFVGSCSVLATAGSGKTTTIIKKTYKWLKENKTWKYIALITFTRKVAEEFRTKIQRECLDTSNLFNRNLSFIYYVRDYSIC